MVQLFVIEEQIAQDIEALRLHTLRRLVAEHLAYHLETLDANENSFGFQVLTTDQTAYTAQETLLDLYVLLLGDSLDKLKRTHRDRFVLDLCVILVGKAENSCSYYSAVRVFRVEDYVQDSVLSAKLVQRLPAVQALYQLLHFFKHAAATLVVFLSVKFRLAQLLKQLLNATDLCHGVVVDGFLEPFLPLRVHFLEVALVRAISMRKRKLQKAGPVNHDLYN